MKGDHEIITVGKLSSFNLMKNSSQSTAKAMIDGKDIESKQTWWKHLIYHNFALVHFLF